MPKASSKKRRKQPADSVQAAARSMQEMAERSEVDAAPGAPEITDEMRAAAAAFGRMGGLKGGPARNASLSKKRKSEIAKKAADARWKGRNIE
jgi:hypothetical protein